MVVSGGEVVGRWAACVRGYRWWISTIGKVICRFELLDIKVDAWDSLSVSGVSSPLASGVPCDEATRKEGGMKRMAQA